MYHVMLLFELLQMLFFVFYKIEIVNEFLEPVSTSLSASLDDNLALALANTATSNSTTIDEGDIPIPETFLMDNYFKFMNFPMYVLEK